MAENKSEGVLTKSPSINKEVNSGGPTGVKSFLRAFSVKITRAKEESDRKHCTPDKIPLEKDDFKECNSLTHYTPGKPLAAMQINQLLSTNNLKEAYQNLLSLREEFEREQAALGHKPPQAPLVNKETDLRILYETLQTKLSDTVRESYVLPSYSAELLKCLACIVEEEEKREQSPGGIGGWRDAWKTAVRNGIREALKGKILENDKQKASSLAIYLADLGEKIVEQLQKVKAEIVNLYPPSFNVFENCFLFCHEFIEEHLKGLLGEIKELKDFYALLDFIDLGYHSEKILGSALLQPEMKNLKAPTFSGDFLDQIKEAYLNSLQENLLALLDDKVKLEKDNVWKKKETPITEGTFLTSEIHMDIYKMIIAYASDSEKIDLNLQKRVLCTCLDKLTLFPKRFEEEFSKQTSSLLNSDVLDGCLWAKYHIAYINSFSSLKESMQGYSHISPSQVKQLGGEIDSIVSNLRKNLLEQFKSEVKPYMQSLMTKTWLNSDAHFQELINRIESYAGHSKCLKHPHAQLFANEVHYHVVKEYISELLKNKYSCKGAKNESAAAKIKEQWNDLTKQFQEMGSKLDWLHPLGDQLSKIIEQKKEKEIKKHLKPLVESYPDITKKHLSAILYFRDCTNTFGLEKKQVIRQFTELKQNLGDSDNAKKQGCAFFSNVVNAVFILERIPYAPRLTFTLAELIKYNTLNNIPVIASEESFINISYIRIKGNSAREATSDTCWEK